LAKHLVHAANEAKLIVKIFTSPKKNFKVQKNKLLLGSIVQTKATE
jgi:hypothetical protein